MRRLLVVILLTLAACGQVDVADPPDTTLATTTTVTIEESSPCVGSSFAEEGSMGVVGESGGDATTVAELGAESHSGCERLIIGLSTASGAPATSTGIIDTELHRQSGVVRVHLDDAITATTTSDLVFDGSLLDRVFIVRDADGSLFVDAHLTAASVARATILTDPARIAIDLQPGGSEIGAAAISENVVVLSPQTGDTTYPLEISGYGRTFEASVIARIRSGDEIMTEDFTTAADYLETWGSFQISIPNGPTGPIQLFVGEDDARDGSERGVYLDLAVLP